MREKLPSIYLRYSIWLSTLIVIILIIILALTVYYVREQSIIELFSTQQAVIAQQTASRVEESIAGCEKGLGMLSTILTGEGAAEAEKLGAMKSLGDEFHEIVLTIVEIDRQDVIVSGYPLPASAKIIGRKIEDPTLSHALKKMHERYVGEIRLFNQQEALHAAIPAKTMGIALPILTGDGAYDGAILAILRPQLIVEHTIALDQRYTNDFYLMDESGMIVFHPDPSLIGKSMQDLAAPGTPPFQVLAYNPRHYQELYLSPHGQRQNSILAFAPIRVGISQWWVVLVTPYDRVLKPVRRASMDIFLGALGLVVVVIITTFSIARSDVKRLRLKEEFKRLKEREEWQGKLLREKMTVEGIIEGSPVPIFVIDREHKVVLWNRACTDLTGYSAEEMINTDRYYKPFYEAKRPFLADFIIDRNEENFEKYYGEGKVRKSETIRGGYEAVKHFPNLRGKDRHLHFLAAPIYDEHGAIIAAIESFLDVSNEVELSRNLQEYAETLQNELNENIRMRKEMEELYGYLQSIIESLPDKIFDLNKDGIINYVSRRIHKDRRGKYDPEGKHFTEFVAPEHRDYVTARWEDAMRGIYKPYELEAVARDGTKRNLLLTPSPVQGTDRILLVQRDITEMKELQRKYYESQKLAAIGQLSAGIAHEVRNPLSSIKMSLQILEKRLQPSGNDFKRFKIAEKEVEHLEKLVSDVLIYAKPSTPQKEPTDMRTVIDRALAMVEKSVHDKEIEVQKRYPDEIEPIAVDSAMLIQALINIFQNAIDAMEMQGKLLIALKPTPSTIVLEIDDNGCGIAEQDLPYLFNPFFTKKNYGTGLGLTHVKKIVDQHQGEIEILSKQGQGTRFIITLPYGNA